MGGIIANVRCRVKYFMKQSPTGCRTFLEKRDVGWQAVKRLGASRIGSYGCTSFRGGVGIPPTQD